MPRASNMARVAKGNRQASREHVVEATALVEAAAVKYESVR